MHPRNDLLSIYTRRCVEQAKRKVPLTSISATYSCGEVLEKLLLSRKPCCGPQHRQRSGLLVVVTDADTAVLPGSHEPLMQLLQFCFRFSPSLNGEALSTINTVVPPLPVPTSHPTPSPCPLSPHRPPVPQAASSKQDETGFSYLKSDRDDMRICVLPSPGLSMSASPLRAAFYLFSSSLSPLALILLCWLHSTPQLIEAKD